MPRLILKMPYIKGNGSHRKSLVKYIATRDGVDIARQNPYAEATSQQQNFIQQLVKDFPDSKNLFEYGDYLQAPTMANASEFIGMALEHNLNRLEHKKNYVSYIAQRPNVEKIFEHGLFSSGDEKINLAQVAKELANHQGNIWTPIISLRREDAASVGYDNAATWQNMLAAQAAMIAENLKIPAQHFKWYAAFHNQGHHPHVHMICYSSDARYGYLTKNGIKNIKSKLVGEIFKERLHEVYIKKTQRRDELKLQVQKSLAKMKFAVDDISNPQVEKLIFELRDELQTVKGKKQYGYLRSPLKLLVDDIIDELAKQQEVAATYKLWQDLQDEIYCGYQDNLPPRLPLSKQKEFKVLKNLLIKEVGRLDFELQQNILTGMSNQYQLPIAHMTIGLLNSLSKIFSDSLTQDSTTSQQKIDSKQFRKIREKKLALGQKIGAPEQENIEQRFN